MKGVRAFLLASGLAACGGEAGEKPTPTAIPATPAVLPCSAATEDASMVHEPVHPASELAVGLSGVVFTNTEGKIVSVSRVTGAATVLGLSMEAKGPVAVSPDVIVYAVEGGGLRWIRPGGEEGGAYMGLPSSTFVTGLRWTTHGLAVGSGTTLQLLSTSFAFHGPDSFAVTGSQLFLSDDGLVMHPIEVSEAGTGATVGKAVGVYSGPLGPIAVDDTHVYGTVVGEIRRWERSTFDTSEHVWSEPGSALTLLGPCLYFSATEGVMRVPKANGTKAARLTKGPVDAYATDGAFLYFLQYGALWRRALP